MKINRYLWLVPVSVLSLSGCVAVTPLEEADIDVGSVYKFSDPAFNVSLYVKFLPVENNEHRLLFATIPDDKKVTDLKLGYPYVIEQDWYNVAKDGEVTFRYYAQTSIARLAQEHPYFTRGHQFKNIASIRYDLDFKNATKLHAHLF